MFPRTALRGAADPRGLTPIRPQVLRPYHHTALPGLRSLTYRRHSGEAPTCNTNNTALIQINDDVEIGELDDTWSNAFAGWNLIASIGSYVSLAGLIIFLFGMGYAFARKVRAASNPLGAGARRLNSAGDRTVGVTLYGLESVLRTILLGQFLSIQPGCVANPTAPIRAAEYDCPHDWY